jgi:hypothetical protein
MANDHLRLGRSCLLIPDLEALDMEDDGYFAACRDGRQLLARDGGLARRARFAASRATPHARRTNFRQSSILELGANERSQSFLVHAVARPSFPENSPLGLVKAGSLARMAQIHDASNMAVVFRSVVVAVVLLIGGSCSSVSICIEQEKGISASDDVRAANQGCRPNPSR